MTPKLFVTLVVFVLVTLVGAACGDSTDSAPAAESEAAVKPGPVEDTEEAEALRQLAYAYWDAFNSYDAVRALGYLEDDYRQQRDDTVRGEIQSVQLFGIRLEVSEHTPPHVLSEDEREMYLNMKEPLGTRRIRMGFREIDGEWMINHAEEPE
jgi:ABC-type Fe3+-citrate transport system substrate-binding protein